MLRYGPSGPIYGSDLVEPIDYQDGVWLEGHEYVPPTPSPRRLSAVEVKQRQPPIWTDLPPATKNPQDTRTTFYYGTIHQP